jgi:MFS family permease
MWNRTSVGLIAGSALAGFGAWVDFLAILTLASYEYHANAYLMALISALLLVPGMLLARRAGRLIDRSNPWPILLTSLALRSGVTVLMVMSPSVLVFCALVALRSVFTLPTEPASNVLVNRLIVREDVPRYFGTVGLLRSISKIAAPAIGALIASRLGEGYAIFMSAFMTLAAILVLGWTWAQSPALRAAEAMVAGTGAGNSQAIEEPPLADMSARARLLRQLTSTVTIYAFMLFVINNQLPVLLRDGGFDKALLGLLVSFAAAGGIVAGTYISRKKMTSSSHPMRATVISVLLTSTCFIGLGLAFTLPVHIAQYPACALFFCTGILGSIEAMRSNTVIVQEFPGSVGTVTATVQFYQSAAMLIAPWLAAIAIPYLSISTLFVIDGGLALVSLAVVTLAFNKMGVRATSPANA